MIVRLTLSLTLLAQLAATACDAVEEGDRARPDSAAIAGARRLDSLARDSTAWVAFPQRVGRIRTGMSRPELIALVGRPIRAGYDMQERCTYIRGTALPRGVQVMVFDGVVARIDVLEPGVPTAEGLEVGATEQQVLAQYGPDAVVSPHAYSGPQWHYVTVTPPNDTAHRIVFETDGAVVKSYRVGRTPEVEWVEGCS